MKYDRRNNMNAAQWFSEQTGVANHQVNIKRKNIEMGSLVMNQTDEL